MVFAGEAFIDPEWGLPDYDAERFWLVVKGILVIVVFAVVLPVLMAVPVEPTNDEETKPAEAVKSKPTRRKKSKTPSKNGNSREHEEKKEKPKEEKRLEAPLVQLNLACIFFLIVLIMRSSNNNLTARSSYVAPLFSPQECQFIIDRAHEAAKLNLEANPDDERLQQSPSGWRKDRHGAYPTTDLNVVTDPFTKEDRAFLAEKLNKRLAPVVERIYGISQAAIRANDMFVVRYDATEGQQKLNQHTDSSHVSFNVLLNDEFEGGGTRFHNRWNDQFYTAKPNVGDVLINNANILHEGLPITKGTRYILVGFTSIDRFDPFTEKSTGLSLFASWLSLPWVQVRMKQGMQARDLDHKKRLFDNKYFVSLFNDVHVAFTLLGDFLSPHRVATLVDHDNTTEYLAALDASETPGDACWFSGQQIHVDVDGKISEFWDDRAKNEAAFREL